MPPNLGNYIKLSTAPSHFRVSTKTLRRRRDQARKSNDNSVLDHFIVVTKDGEVFEKPTPDIVTDLVKQGRQPDWHVNHDWVRGEFGAYKTDQSSDVGQATTKDQPTVTPNGQPKSGDSNLASLMANLSPEVQFIIRTFQLHITDLENRLDAGQDERIAMREHHQNTIDKMTKLLPAAAPEHSKQQGTAQASVVDTTPRVEPVKTQPKPKPTKPPDKKQPATFTQWARRMFGSR